MRTEAHVECTYYIIGSFWNVDQPYKVSHQTSDICHYGKILNQIGHEILIKGVVKFIDFLYLKLYEFDHSTMSLL